MGRFSLFACALLLVGCRLGQVPSASVPISIACPERYLLDAPGPGLYVITDLAPRRDSATAGFGRQQLVDADGRLQSIGGVDTFYSRSTGRRQWTRALAVAAVPERACPVDALICPTEGPCDTQPGCAVVRVGLPAGLFDPFVQSLDELHSMLDSRFVDDGNCGRGLPASWCRASSSIPQRRHMLISAAEFCASIGGLCGAETRRLVVGAYRSPSHFRIEVAEDARAHSRELLLELDPPLTSADGADLALVRLIDMPTPGATQSLAVQRHATQPASIRIFVDTAGSKLLLLADGLLRDRRIASAHLETISKRDADDLPKDALGMWLTGRPPYQWAFGDDRCDLHSEHPFTDPQLDYSAQLRPATVVRHLPRTDPLAVKLRQDPWWQARMWWSTGYAGLLLLGFGFGFTHRNAIIRRRPAHDEGSDASDQQDRR